MERTRYSVDCSAVADLKSFVLAMNTGFIDRIGGHWNGNLDAFNDYLSWPDDPYDLILTDSAGLPAALAEPTYGGRAAWDILQEIFADNTMYCSVALS